MIYTRIEWIWTDEGLKETFVESCEYEGEFVMCGGGSDDSGSGSDSSSSEKQQMREQKERERQEDQRIKERRNRQFNPSGNIYTQPSAPTPPATPTPSEPSGGGGEGVGFQDYRDYTPPPKPSKPKVKASTSSTEPEKAGIGYTPETGFTYNTTKERSDAAWKASQHATIHGTLKGTEWEDDQFMLNTTSSLRTNDPDYLGDDSSSSGSATTTTAKTTPTGDDKKEIVETATEEPLSTFVDDEALRKTRRRLRDRFGRRATRGGGAETVGTGYSLGS